MGIDYDAKIVYGWIFDYTMFDQIIKFEELEGGDDENDYDDNIYEKDWYEKLDILEPYLYKKYGLFLGYAYPYYDPGEEEIIYFISLADSIDKNKMREILDTKLSDDLISLLKNIDLDPNDIDIHCIPHVS